jgi:hypothetical protein
MAEIASPLILNGTLIYFYQFCERARQEKKHRNIRLHGLTHKTSRKSHFKFVEKVTFKREAA